MLIIQTSETDCYELQIRAWGKFMDDVFCIWNHRFESFNLFLERLNNFDKNIKFIVESEENNKLPFLDILLIKRGNYLLFSIYRKLHTVTDI